MRRLLFNELSIDSHSSRFDFRLLARSISFYHALSHSFIFVSSLFWSLSQMETMYVPLSANPERSYFALSRPVARSSNQTNGRAGTSHSDLVARITVRSGKQFITNFSFSSCTWPVVRWCPLGRLSLLRLLHFASIYLSWAFTKHDQINEPLSSLTFDPRCHKLQRWWFFWLLSAALSRQWRKLPQNIDHLSTLNLNYTQQVQFWCCPFRKASDCDILWTQGWKKKHSNRCGWKHKWSNGKHKIKIKRLTTFVFICPFIFVVDQTSLTTDSFSFCEILVRCWSNQFHLFRLNQVDPIEKGSNFDVWANKNRFAQHFFFFFFK